MAKLCTVDDYIYNPTLCVVDDTEYVDLVDCVNTCIVLKDLLHRGKPYTECPYYKEEVDMEEPLSTITRVRKAYHPDGMCDCYIPEAYVLATGQYAKPDTYYWKSLVVEPFATREEAEHYLKEVNKDGYFTSRTH